MSRGVGAHPVCAAICIDLRIHMMRHFLSCLMLLSCASTLNAQPGIFSGADLQLGARLIAEGQCAQCHIKRVGGDGSAIYRPLGRISAPGFLRGMVEQCNSELNLGFFPEEVTAVAAVLNRDYYKFK